MSAEMNQSNAVAGLLMSLSGGRGPAPMISPEDGSISLGGHTVAKPNIVTITEQHGMGQRTTTTPRIDWSPEFADFLTKGLPEACSSMADKPANSDALVDVAVQLIAEFEGIDERLGSTRKAERDNGRKLLSKLIDELESAL